LGICIQRLNRRAKAHGPNQNKNAQIQLVKLSKQKVFVKLKNISHKKIGLVILPSIKLGPINAVHEISWYTYSTPRTLTFYYRQYRYELNKELGNGRK
jgi:hypothetical protein